MKVVATELVVTKKKRESTPRDRWPAGGPTSVCQKKPGMRTDFAANARTAAAGTAPEVPGAEAGDST